MAVRTRRRVASETPGGPRTTLETVDLETPACEATSRMVGGLLTLWAGSWWAAIEGNGMRLMRRSRGEPRVHEDLHRPILLGELNRFRGTLQRHAVGDDLRQGKPVEVSRKQVHRRDVRGRGLAPDPDHAHVLRADVRVGVDPDRAHVDKRAGFDHGPAVSNQVEALGKRLRDAGAVDDDVRPGVRVLARQLRPLFRGGRV